MHIDFNIKNMGNIESGAKKEGDLTLGIAPTIRAFDKGGCQIPTMSPLLPGRGEVGLNIDRCISVREGSSKGHV